MPSIAIDRAQASEIESLLSLYVELFQDREPLTKCIGWSRERMMSIARTMYAGADGNALSQGLGWIARDQARANQDIGFILCDDPAAAPTAALPDDLTAQEMRMVSAVTAWLEAIRSPVQDKLGLAAGTGLHVSAVGVAPGYEGAGIATRLLQTAMADAAARGYRFAFAECTSSPSRRCHEKAGFTSVHRVSGEKLLVAEDGALANSGWDVHLMWKDLANE